MGHTLMEGVTMMTGIELLNQEDLQVADKLLPVIKHKSVHREKDG